MNILVLNGSPKGERSNTLKLAKAFLEGFTQTQSADTEIVDIYKLNIRECLGCFACWSKTPGKCAITDDMTDVLQKILRADVVVWSFPLYYFSLPSRLKMVIGRRLLLWRVTPARADTDPDMICPANGMWSSPPAGFTSLRKTITL